MADDQHESYNECPEQDECKAGEVDGRAPSGNAEVESPFFEPASQSLSGSVVGKSDGDAPAAGTRADTPGSRMSVDGIEADTSSTPSRQSLADTGQGLAVAPQVIESASATTSPNNSSGPLAYVITAVVLAILLVIGVSIGTLFAAAGEAVSSGGAGSLSGRGSDDLDDLEGLLDELEEDSGSGLGSNSGSGSGSSGSYSGSTKLDEDNVLSYDYYCFDYAVGDFVYAADYAESQEVVSSFVRALIEADSSATANLRSHVRAAAQTSDAATRASELELAAKTCADAQASLAAVEAPLAASISGSHAESISEDLAEAQKDVVERWEDLANLVAIMQSPDGHTASELDELDTDAGNVTSIAIELTDALSDSASHK